MSTHDPRELMQRYADGQATAEEVAALNSALQADAALRALYLDYVNLDVALAAAADGRCLEEPALPLKTKTPALAWPRWLAVAASIVLCAGGAWSWQRSRETTATVTNSAGTTLRAGDAMRHERHELAAGTVEFITARGARVAIEAPAAFRFESPQRLRMFRGRVAAEVPAAAKGFTVVTPTGQAVDLGTKFGVDVPTDGPAEIHVFQGEVIAQPRNGAARQSLRDGQALTLQGGAKEMRSAAFIRPGELGALTAGLAAGQRARAESALAALGQDPALITLLDFEGAELPPGQFRMVQGRWPGSRAPEFVNLDDHMKLNVGAGQEYPQLTLAAWVRLDRLGAPYQSLYHTDDWSAGKPGQVHWMIVRNATMRLALRANRVAPASRVEGEFADSQTPVLPEQGRWVHLATVYDAPRRTARFYLNGELDVERTHDVAHPALLGPAQIGNWDRQDRKLSGRLDEFILLSRALSDEEVRALHAAGNPYR